MHRLTVWKNPCLAGLLGGLWLLLTAGAASAAAATPFKMNLDEFERARKTMALPNGMTAGYAEFGPRNGTPVVLVHGFTDSVRDWLPLIPELDKSFHVILVDLRGHGKSSKPECCYTRLDMAYDIKLLLDVLKVPDADMVGHSLGSLVVQSFAEYWPKRTRHVVLIASTAGAHPSCPAPAGDATMDLGAFRRSLDALEDPLDPDSKFMKDWWWSPTPVDEAFMRRERQDAAAMPIGVWRAIYDQGLHGVNDQLQSTLPWLTAPTLLIWGEKDQIFGPKDRCSLKAALPKATVKVFDGLGHNPLWEDPVAVARVLNEFLDAKH